MIAIILVTLSFCKVPQQNLKQLYQGINHIRRILLDQEQDLATQRQQIILNPFGLYRYVKVLQYLIHRWKHIGFVEHSLVCWEIALF